MKACPILLATLALLVAGLGPLLEREAVRAALSVVGGLMLLAMAAPMLLAVVRGSIILDSTSNRSVGRHGRIVLAGAVASLSNPYWIVWWATIGLSLLTKAYAVGLIGVAAFYAGHVLGDLTWFSAVSTAISAGRRWITLRVYRGMIAVAACFLAALGAWFLASGIRFLD